MALTLSTQRTSASFYSNESAPRWKYDVFLSFRGVDTRKGFVSHLYHELCKCQGITTFFDDRELEEGKSIPLELPSAIKESHIAIVVLSPNYASSKWCLDELTTILQCMEGRDSVLPVFYDMDPSDVGNQRGCFAKAFADHEEKFITTEDKKKVTQWRADLKKISKFSGWHLKNFKSERELIEKIVNRVWRKVQATFIPSDSSRKFVGTDYAFEQLSLLLAHDANDVRFIGITGMGGIGKTTVAKLVYGKICHHFEVHCFLVNVREVYAKNGMVDLAKKLLLAFLKEGIAGNWDEEHVSILTEKFLHNKKVLLVLDDVDELKQLQVLAGNQGWFGMGSRIIVTTRNQRLLVQHDIATSYKVQGLNDAEALKLFSLHAFKKDQPEEGFLELSKYFINHAGGLPLALETLGSALFKRGLDAWHSVRDNLSKIPNPTIFDKLKISYDGLEEWEKSIFLDVACFYKGYYTERVIESLDSSNSFGISSRIVIDVLIERSILYQDHEKCIQMHDLIQEMAWTIIGHKSKEPGLRSRLWLYDDISHVFTTNTGSSAIEVISVHLPRREWGLQWNWEAFSKMDRLRILIIDNLSSTFSSAPKFLPWSLRIIIWFQYPSNFLRTNMRLLTELHMHGSSLVRLWEGKEDLPNLRWIDLSNSSKLKSTPDFSGVPNLVKLNLRGCFNLVEIHPSIAHLKKLEFLNFTCCSKLESLPSELKMDSLEFLSLSNSDVKKIPEFGEQMKNVSSIDLTATPIEKITSSIGHLVGLQELCLVGCSYLLNLPRSICNLKYLRRLQMQGCSKIGKLPGDMDHLCNGSDAKAREGWGLLRLLGLGKSRPDPPCLNLVLSSLNSLCSLTELTELSLKDCKLCEGDIPDDIGCLSFLERLDLSGNNFVSLPESIRRLSKLSYLDLERCKSLQKLPPLPSNSKLHVDVDNCTSLRSLSDPSKLNSRFANLYDFNITCLNCIALVPDEGWINTILSRVLKFATDQQGISYFMRGMLCPGSEIPEWFSIQSVGHSVNVELPPPSCTNWLGIAFCVLFQDLNQYSAILAALHPNDYFEIRCLSFMDSPGICTKKIRSLESEHLWVFYLPRRDCCEHVFYLRRRDCCEHVFLFETYFNGGVRREVAQADLMGEAKVYLNYVKKCGARLLYKQDLEKLNQVQARFGRTQPMTKS
ncbi:TMV resistance protein N [Pyrus x bretschneideri]|uniref:TMV resistance protein N n=1 Tax=Pyrus x bretschneideri TaxID=225117 RepID=UPI0020303950|nr:TMV resistance protein N [Pyrus x bretschneideri]